MFRPLTRLQDIHTYYIQMPRPKKQNPKQLNAAISWTFCHQSFQTSSPTQESTLASTIPPNSVPPSTIDPSDVPAIDSWDQSEGSGEYSPGPEENSITIDDYPEDVSSDEGYRSDDYMSEMDGQELRDSLEFQMEREIEQIEGGENPTAYGMLMREIKADQWKKVETNRSLGYNGLSRRKKQLDLQKAEQAEEENKKLRAS